jgi:hypothetical protein
MDRIPEPGAHAQFLHPILGVLIRNRIIASLPYRPIAVLPDCPIPVWP